MPFLSSVLWARKEWNKKLSKAIRTLLKKRIHKRRNTSSLGKHQKQPEYQQNHHKRNQKPEFCLPQKLQKFPGFPAPIKKSFKKIQFSSFARCSTSRFKTIYLSSAKISRPDFKNVLNAFCGLFTIGSPFRLKEVFIRT